MNLDDIPTPITEAIWKQKGGVDVDDMVNLEQKLHIAREALEWANSELGKCTKPNPVTKALATIKP